MDKEKLLKEWEKLLQKMADSMQEELIPAIYQEAEKEGDIPMVNVMFDDMGDGDEEVYGEFCFRPLMSDEDQVQFFTCMLTLSDDVPEEHRDKLFEAMSYINFQIPCGCFTMDKTGTFLCFRESMPMPIDLMGDELYEQMNLIAGNAVVTTDAYMSALLQVSRGEMSVEDVLELLE